MSNVKEFKTNIVKWFNKTNSDNFDNGMAWYRDAHNFAKYLSKKHNVSLEKTIGVISALSPNNKWDRNKIDTDKFLMSPSIDTKVCTFKQQRQKALDILESDGKPETIKDILGGIKTQNFFSNILNYKTCDNVTVDLWAFRSVGVEPKKKYIKDITLAYKLLAKEFKMQPHQLQAIVWGSIRGSLN